MSPVRHTLPYTDVTNVPVTRPSGTGTASALGMSEEDVERVRELEKRRVPLGFAPPADKPKRKRKT